MVKDTTDAGADLGRFLCRRQPVEPRHQQILQRRGYRQSRQWPMRQYRSLASTSKPESRTAFVSSSTKSGTPSVLDTIRSAISGGSFFPPATRSMIAALSSASNRPSGSTGTCDRSFQRGSNSGRAVTTSRAGNSASRSITFPATPPSSDRSSGHPPPAQGPDCRCRSLDLPRQLSERTGPHCRGRQFWRHQPTWRIDRQQRREEAQQSSLADYPAKKRLKLVEPSIRTVVANKSRRPFELRDDRMERAVDVEREQK